MSEATASRAVLYTGLAEHLGPELTDALMTYLPETPGANLATKPDFDRLEVRVDALASDMRHLTHRMDDNFDRLSQRLDRHAQIMAAGFIALTTTFIALASAVIASGFLG